MKRGLLYIIFILILQSNFGQVNFYADQTEGCGPLDIKFKDLTPKAASWEWDLGNGNTSKLKEPSAIYTSAGHYTITLTVVDSNGNRNSLSKVNFIHVFKEPKAIFTVSNRKVCPNETATFTDLSTGGDAAIVSWKWDMGDGTTYNIQNPNHAWKVPGYKNISLIVKDKNGCSHQILSNAYILTKTPPIAEFAVDSTFACTKPLNVNFTDASSPKNISWIWDFGDGTPLQNIQNPTHLYKKFGKFTVSLSVKDLSTGCSISKTAKDLIVLDSLVVDFDAIEKTLCDTGETVQFVNKTPQYGAYTARWTFGDGSSSNSWVDKHQYHNFGVYPISLQITGAACGQIKFKSGFISILQKPALSIRANDTGACGYPYSMTLFANAPASSSVFWDFGDNQFGSGKKVNHTWNNKDSFLVSAMAVDNNTCRDTQSMWIRKNELLVYADGETKGCVPFTSKANMRIFNNTSTISRIEWYYKNNRIDSGSTMNFLFADTGRFPVKMQVENSKKCIDSPTIFILAGQKIKPTFIVQPQIVCLHDSVFFTNTTSNIPVKAHKFSWLPGEGNIFEGRDLVKSYSFTTGRPKITLISEHFGCKDSFSTIDSLLIKAPRVNYILPSVGCVFPNSLPIINNTKEYTHFEWRSDPKEISKNNDSLFLDIKNHKEFDIFIYAYNDTNQCSDSAKYHLKFSTLQPQALTSHKMLSNCPPALLLIKDSGSIGNEFWWKLPNGVILKNTDSLFHTFDNFGKYEITRFAKYNLPLQSCLDSQVIKITLPKPEAQFAISPNQGCTPVNAIFLDSNYFTGKMGKWTFGDTSLSTSNFSNTFTFHYPFQSSPTRVVFTAFDSLGHCKDSTIKWVNITGPNAKIITNPFYTCKNTRLQLSHTSLSPGIKSWRWYADDTLLSSNKNAEYIVYTNRYVNLVLEVTDSFGCTSKIPKRVFVRMFKPDVKISSDTAGAFCPPLVVHFYDKTTNFNNTSETWLWNFGDGSTSTLKNPAHTFINTGDYTISLTVKNYVGCIATMTFPAFIQIKGPVGEIITSQDSGCTPLEVHFKTTGSGLKNVRWDFGDGSENDGLKPTHIFNKAGIHYPSAIMEDSAGCKTGTKLLNPIHTNQTPIAKIKQLTWCDGDSLKFADSSQYFGIGRINKWVTSHLQVNKPNITFKSQKDSSDNFNFIALGQFGCNDSVLFYPIKSRIHFNIEIQSDTSCLGKPIIFNDKSSSDTSFYSRRWSWQGQFDTSKTWKTTSKKPGYSDLKLKLVNQLKCNDSIVIPNAIFIGDSARPTGVRLHSVSVLNNFKQQITFEPSYSSDWQYYSLYQRNMGSHNLLLKNHTRFDTILTASVGDAHLEQQCFLIENNNLCFRESLTDTSQIHCTIELKATANNNAIDLKWSPYIGSSPLKYFIQRTRYPDTLFVDIDSVSGNTHYYGDTNVICTNKYSYRIVGKLNENFYTKSDTSSASPFYSPKIKSPYLTLVSVDPNEKIQIFGDTLKNQYPAVLTYHLEKSLDANQFSFLKTFNSNENIRYIDNSVNTNVNQYYYRINATDVCGGSSPWSGISSNILLKSHNRDSNIVLTWNKYIFWPSGVLSYEIEQADAFENYKTFYSTSDTFLVLTNQGSSCSLLPKFRVKAISNPQPEFNEKTNLVSYSNVTQIESGPSVFIPNIFTPNSDNLNAVFKPECSWIKNYDMSIFNRWGEKLYEGSGCGNSWNGFYENQPAPSGNYIFLITVTGANNKKYYYNGVFQLIR